MAEPRLTIAVVTRRRQALLRRCLDSFPRPLPAGVEVLLLLNGADALPAGEAARWPWLRAVPLERVSRPAARNRAAREARGGFVHFLDDDTVLPPGFVEGLLAALSRHPEAACLGGPNVGAPGAAPLQRACDFLLRSPLGAGPMRLRYAPAGAERRIAGWSLMLCNLGVRRELFERGLRFPERCASAEENLLVWRLEREAGPAVYCPSLWVYHERRESVASFCRQVFDSGRGRAQISRLAPRSLLPATVLPLAAALALAALPWAVAAWPARLYGLACLAESCRLLLGERDLAAAARLPWLFPLAHASYAAGMAAGLCEWALACLLDLPPFAKLSPESHRPPSCGTS